MRAIERRSSKSPILLTVAICTAMIAGHASAHDRGIGSLGPIEGERALLPGIQIFSTIPTNGDLNPYGAAYVPRGFAQGGSLNPGDVLISNFNDSTNTQGTGTTIVRLTPEGQQSTFFQGQPGIGLTLALGTMNVGLVAVGSVPTTDGTFATIEQGSLLIVDKNGNLVANLTDSTFLDGPWGLTINDEGGHVQIFVSNVLNGTVSRLDCAATGSSITVLNKTTIASGYAHRGDPNAVVLGPTGLSFNPQLDVLYVASTADNEIFAVNGAGQATQSNGTGNVIYQDAVHLHGPLAMVQLPNGHLLTSNGDAINADPTHPSELVEFTVEGRFVQQTQLDLNTDAAFGVAVEQSDDVVNVAAVNDNQNTVEIFSSNF